MSIGRERIMWAFACYACMKDMTSKMIHRICKCNRDIFIIRGKEVKFTKTFLNEAAEVDSLP